MMNSGLPIRPILNQLNGLPTAVNSPGHDVMHGLINSSITTLSGQGPIATIDQIRTSVTLIPYSYVISTDTGKQGMWIVDPTDTSSADNEGTILVNQSAQRLKRLYVGALHATWFGLIPNDRNSRAINALKFKTMRDVSDYSHILFNGIGNTYYMGVSPETPLYQDSAYCIGLINFQGILECDKGVILNTQTGYVGIQTARTIGDCNVHLVNVTLVHDGGRDAVPHYMQNYTTKSDGSKDYTGHELDWSQSWGDYKLNGLNMWGAGRMSNINISGYPGHGMCVFGSTGIRFPGPTFTITGTIQRFNQYDKLIFDDPTIITTQFGYRTTLHLNGVNYQIEGNYSGDTGIVYRPTDSNSLAVGTRVTATANVVGNTLFADSIVADGVNNISFCGGLGIFTTSDEANQSNFDNFRIGNTGAWGVCDSSLLMNRFENLHCTQCGEHFNSLYTNPQVLVMGGFTNGGVNTAGSVLVGGYREQGNQGNDQPNYKTAYIGGFYPGGNPGLGIVDGKLSAYSGSPDTTKIDYSDGLTFTSGNKVVRLSLDPTKGLCIDGKPIQTSN